MDRDACARICQRIGTTSGDVHGAVFDAPGFEDFRNLAEILIRRRSGDDGMPLFTQPLDQRTAEVQ